MIALIQAASRLPFWVLHRISDFLYYLLFYVIRYRRSVVRENLRRSFPTKPPAELARIEKKFYRNFCDILVESIKYVSISQAEFLDRCKMVNPEFPREMAAKNLNLAVLTSHLGNWDALSYATALAIPHLCFGLYKPLSNQKLNQLIEYSRGRSGLKMIPIQKIKQAIDSAKDTLYAVGLLADQAPHHYRKAVQVNFLRQKTFVFPGPGLLCIQHELTPTWLWMKRTGRSRFEWGMERIELPENPKWNAEEQAQVDQIAKQRRLSSAEASRVFGIIKEYSRRLERRIEEQPEDWLWSHRRWKKR